MQTGGSEGIWWLPKSTTDGYFVITNLGTHTVPVALSVFDAAGRENRQNLSLPEHQTFRFSIRALVQAAGFSSEYGGIRVSTNAHAGSLDTLAFLYDDAAGFGAILKMFGYDPKAQLAERDYARTGQWTLRAPMLALSTPDPSLAFPAGTSLHPLLFISNVTGKTIAAALRFNWRAGNATGKAAGPTLQLAPYQTQQVDVAAMQKSGAIPSNANWALVTLTTNSLPDEVVAIASSYTDSLRYGAQTPFNDQMTYRWEGGMWAYDAYHDSIITAGNGGTQPIQARFTLFYNQGTKRYDLEQALQPDGQMWVDVGQIIREQIPDKNGSTLPPTLTTGSYEITDLSHHGAGTLFEGKVIYDKMYGDAAYGCALCCGYATINYGFWYDPLGIPDLGTAPQGVQAEDMCEDQYDDVSDAFYGSWTTGNSSVATADHYGTHTGTGLGSTTSNAHGELNANDVPRMCPLHGYNPTGGDNTFGITSVSPSPVVIGTSGTMTFTGSGLSGKGTPTVHFSAGGITTGSTTVVNDSTVTASYTVSCSAPSQEVSLSFSEVSTNSLAMTVSLPSAPAPSIMFGGSNVTNTQQSVVVGQQIALTASVPSLPACMSLSSQSWSTPPGTAVGGYTNAAGNGIPDTTGGVVQPLPANNGGSYTFYWAYPQNSMQMTYQYAMAGGGGQVNSPTATATFNVSGPTNFGMQPPDVGAVEVSPDDYLELSSIQLDSSGTGPSGDPGTFASVQLITKFNVVYYNGGNCLFSVGTGLDTQFPYSNGQTFFDAPGIPLYSNETEATADFAATVYFMWKSGTSGSIWVPLGYVTWKWSGDAVQNSGSWSVKSGSGTADGLTVSATYPQWSSYVQGIEPPCH